MHEKVNKLLSYNAILNFIIDNRDTGKSTQFKKRALRRSIKKDALCVWLRRHKDEIKKAKKDFLNDKFFKVLEIDYKDRFKKEDFKIVGNYAYYKNKRFVYFCAVSEAVSDNGIDDENIDTIVFDEFCVEEHRYNYYRGDEVSDFFKIFFTKKRTHADGTTKAYNVLTDKTTVGEALLDAQIIAGEDGQYGLYVKTVDGETLDYDTDGKYWAFYINGEYGMTGVDMTDITEGTAYEFRAE